MKNTKDNICRNKISLGFFILSFGRNYISFEAVHEAFCNESFDFIIE